MSLSQRPPRSPVSTPLRGRKGMCQRTSQCAAQLAPSSSSPPIAVGGDRRADKPQSRQEPRSYQVTLDDLGRRRRHNAGRSALGQHSESSQPPPPESAPTIGRRHASKRDIEFRNDARRPGRGRSTHSETSATTSGSYLPRGDRVKATGLAGSCEPDAANRDLRPRSRRGCQVSVETVASMPRASRR